MLTIPFSGDHASEQRASNSDRKWFARNPHRTYRVRRCIRDEFPRKRFDGIDLAKFTLWTLVRQLEPGLRIRLALPVRSGAKPIDADWTIGPLFECLLAGSDFGSAFSEALVNAFLPPAHVLRALGGVQ
jgi:hypothetical protein